MKKIIACFILILVGRNLLAQSQSDGEVQILKSARSAINDAIARHDIKGMSQYWLDELVLVRGNSTITVGKENIISEWEKLFKDNPNVNYVRTPIQITISSNDTLAWETGSWKAFNSYSKGGNYSAMWKKRNDSWKIVAELFVSLF